MKAKRLILAMTAIFLIGGVHTGFAQPHRGVGHCPGMGGGPGFGPGDGPGILARAEALDLKPEQVKELKALRLNMAKETLRLRSELELKQLELRELLFADEPDIGRIEAKIDEMAPLRTELHKKRIEHRLATREVLTPEQRAKLDLTRTPGKRHRGAQRSRHRGQHRL